MKWCQVRVFLITCAGVLVGNVLSRELHVIALVPVLLCGGSAWVAANYLNSRLAKNGVACEPVIIENRK